jgi:hypothetical protein
MRTTVELDDHLLEELKRRAQQDGVPFDEFIDRVLRSGLRALDAAGSTPRTPFRQSTYDLGVPKMPLDKATSLAFELEDEEIINKMRRSGGLT